MKKLIILSFFFVVLIACKKEQNKNLAIEIVKIESPASTNSMQPFLFNNGKNLWMSWTEKINDSLHTLNYSKLENGKWENPIEITRGDNWFVNWADFPAIAENKGNILTHILKKSDPATFSYDIHVQLSKADNDSNIKEFKLHTDSTKTEHGFVTMIPYLNDSFFMTWLDGRNTGGGGHGDPHSTKGAMQIRAASVLPTGEVFEESLVDNKTCDCCQTSAAITSQGPIIVYRDRSDEEVRDIYISRMVNGSWSTPKPIHNDLWKINGCPVNGPKAAAFNNSLVVAWFTAADNIPKVNLSFSNNNGESFDSPIQIDNGNAIGRVDVAMLDDENALISWMEAKGDIAEIRVLKVNKNGVKKNPLLVSSLSASRSSGFPQMEVLNDIVYFAWNDDDENQPTVKTASVQIAAFD